MTNPEMPVTSADILPCPFCSDLVTKSMPEMRSGLGEFWVHCTNCDCSSKMCMSSASATHVWNRRAAPTDKQRIVEHPQTQPVAPDVLREDVNQFIRACEHVNDETWIPLQKGIMYWRDRFKEALAAQPVAAPSQDAWMPIETAPKDGSEVLCCEEIRLTKVGHILGGHRFIAKFVQDDVYVGKWITSSGFVQPTHWVPLPAAYSTREV